MKRVQLQPLCTDFDNLCMKSGELIFYYFIRCESICDKIEDVIIMEKILRLMTSKFNYVISFIEEFKDIDELTIHELQTYFSLFIVTNHLIRQRRRRSPISSNQLKRLE